MKNVKDKINNQVYLQVFRQVFLNLSSGSQINISQQIKYAVLEKNCNHIRLLVNRMAYGNVNVN